MENYLVIIPPVLTGKVDYTPTEPISLWEELRKNYNATVCWLFLAVYNHEWRDRCESRKGFTSLQAEMKKKNGENVAFFCLWNIRKTGAFEKLMKQIFPCGKYIINPLYTISVHCT